jgi:triphosphatase
MSARERPVEMELKLLLPNGGAEGEVIAALRDGGYRVKELGPVRNTDTYLDTFDWLLLKHNLSLRYRLCDGKALYTVKSTEPLADGIARRMETEVHLETAVDAPADVPAKEIRRLVADIIHPRRLLEHIQVRTDRRRYRLGSPEGAKLELAFDATTFATRGLHPERRALNHHELEAELLDGPEEALPALAAFLARHFVYPPASTSKLAAGMARLRVTVPSKKSPEKLWVQRDDRLDLALRKIVTVQLQRLQENLPGVRRDIDTEFVHQARVATRRMRSALRLYRDATPPAAGAYFAAELRWLGGLFGAVRDLDVFLLNLERDAERIARFSGSRRDAFAARSGELRSAALRALIEGLASQRYATLERRLARFVTAPLPARPRAPLARKRVSEIAPPLVREKFAAVIDQGHAVLARGKLKEYHRLRIEMKRLRYACEFVAPAYGSALDAFIERTVEIQDCLGEIQDTVFAAGLVTRLYREWTDRLVEPGVVFLLGAMAQRQREIRDTCRQGFARTWERFAAAETAALLEQALSPAAGAP